MGLFDDLIPQQPGAGPGQPQLVQGGAANPAVGLFDDLIPAPPSVGKDIANTIPAALLRGVASLPGIPGDLQRLKDQGVDWLGRKAAKLITGQDIPSTYELDEQNRLPGSKDMIAGVERATGPLYKPKTTPGEYANTIGEFAPGAMIGAPMRAGAAAMQALKFGVVPGLASEGAGQATKGTYVEPYARLGGALFGAGAVGALTPGARPAATAIGEAGRNVSPDQWRRAQELMDTAAETGARLTGPQAIQYATGGGTRFGDLARVTEQSRLGGQIMKQDAAAIPGGNRAAMGDALDNVAGAVADPYTVAPAVGKAAQAELDRVRTLINDKAKPYYDSSRAVEIPPADFVTIQSNPSYQAALKKVRSDPILNDEIKGLPDNAIGVIDEVKKQLDDMARAAGKSGERYLAGRMGAGRKNMLTAADVASTDYATARAIGAEGRQTKLGPLEAAPTGALAATTKTADAAKQYNAQASVLFNPNPLPGGERAISEAVANVVKTDPEAARALVRMKLEQSFNEATQRLQGGDNQYGGAKYAAVIRGNPQQARNLEAAVRALPEGDAAWNGLRRVLDVFEAQGTRQPVGSQTAFNTAINEELRGGKPIGEIAALVATPKRWTSFVNDWYQGFRLGKNTEQMAEIFTTPDAITQMRALSGVDRNSQQARQIVAQIVIGHMAGSAPGRGPSASPALPPPSP